MLNFKKKLTFKTLTPIMIEGNWLLSYATIDGIQLVLNGMNRRTKGLSKMNEATKELKEHDENFKTENNIVTKKCIINM